MRTTVEMAREAGLHCAVLLYMYGKESALCDSEIEELRRLERFAELVRADEREACAKVAEDKAAMVIALLNVTSQPIAIAAAIRNRRN